MPAAAATKYVDGNPGLGEDIRIVSARWLDLGRFARAQTYTDLFRMFDPWRATRRNVWVLYSINLNAQATTSGLSLLKIESCCNISGGEWCPVRGLSRPNRVRMGGGYTRLLVWETQSAIHIAFELRKVAHDCDRRHVHVTSSPRVWPLRNGSSRPLSRLQWRPPVPQVYGTASATGLACKLRRVAPSGSDSWVLEASTLQDALESSGTVCRCGWSEIL